VDCIKRARQQPENRHDWKIGTMIFMAVAMSFNLGVVMMVLQKYFFTNYFYKLKFPFFPERINSAISYLILYIFPCIVLNYLLIFKNQRYKELLEKYPYHNGKLFIVYFLISVPVPAILLLGAVIFSRIF